MPAVKEVSRDDAESIWTEKCPMCGGKLLGAWGSNHKDSINVMCEFGCQKFNVPPRPALPQRI